MGVVFKFLLGLSIFAANLQLQAQNVEIYRNFDDFEAKYLKTPAENDTMYIINFWATWCAPCVKELPHFEKAIRKHRDNSKVQFIFASLDFSHQIETKLKPFVIRRPYMKRNVAISDPRQQIWIDKVSEEWSGSIPMTLLKYKDQYAAIEGAFHYKEDLFVEIEKFTNKHIK